MSVNYKSALIYGYSCDPNKWSSEERERMEELGWDIISDVYDDNFLYIGKILSKTDCYEEARVDCLASLEQVIIDVNHIYSITSWYLTDKLPPERSMYHLCYAT